MNRIKLIILMSFIVVGLISCSVKKTDIFKGESSDSANAPNKEQYIDILKESVGEVNKKTRDVKEQLETVKEQLETVKEQLTVIKTQKYTPAVLKNPDSEILIAEIKKNSIDSSKELDNDYNRIKNQPNITANQLLLEISKFFDSANTKMEILIKDMNRQRERKDPTTYILNQLEDIDKLKENQKTIARYLLHVFDKVYFSSAFDENDEPDDKVKNFEKIMKNFGQRDDSVVIPDESNKTDKNKTDETDDDRTKVKETYYTIRTGDTLGNISTEFYGTARFFNCIYIANENTLPSPNRIIAGATIIIPPHCK